MNAPLIHASESALNATCAHRLAVVLSVIAATLAPAYAASAPSSGGSVDCASPSGDVEGAICTEAALAAQDRKLVDVYAAASRSASAEQKNRLFAEQQSWLSERNRCSGAKDRTACLMDRYTRRIADLQAQFKLVASRGPFRYECNKSTSDILTAQYFETDPPTARFFHDGRTVTAYLARAGSGARYENANISYWEHQGEASVVWYGRKMTCNASAAK